MKERVTTALLRRYKEQKRKIAALTAYDYPTALRLDEAGVDVLLVGDSLGMVLLGYPDTTRVTMDEMIHHTKAVARAASRAMVVGDLPFLSYHTGVGEALTNAGRFVQEAGAQAVKLEGGGPRVAETVSRLTEAGIPVMGHLGLTPQSVNQLGGYRVQGRDAAAAAALLEDALRLERAGVFALVLEMVPAPLAAVITRRLAIPTIGIGAGPHCDGQILVTHDMVGLYHQRAPRFVKVYADLARDFRRAVEAYVREVREGKFPGPEHAFDLDPEVLEALSAAVEGEQG